MNFNFKFILKRNIDLIIAICLYLLLATFLFKYFAYVTGVDGMCYVNIAKRYAANDLSNAINGYWSPLFSWLLVPFLMNGYSNLSALTYAKIVSLIIGLFTLVGLHLLTHRFKIDHVTRMVFTFSLVPIILSFAFTKLTPDLLMACA